MDKNKKKILVTGIQGNIGRAIQKVSIKYEIELYGCDFVHKNSENYMRADISEYREIEKSIVLFKPDIVINLAGEFGRANGEDYYEKVWKTNAIGVKNLIKLQEIYGFRLVHASSSEVYGDYKDVIKESVMDEYPIRQLNDYAISKWVNEQQIKNSIEKNKTDSVIFRIFNAYGPGEIFNEYRSAVCRFVYCCLENKPVRIYSGHERTHTYIFDVARMILEVSLKGKAGEAYNLAGPDSDRTTMVQVNQMIEDLSGCSSSSRIIDENMQENTTAIKVVSNKKFMNLCPDFLFTPLNEGLKNTIEWYKEYLKY